MGDMMYVRILCAQSHIIRPIRLRKLLIKVLGCLPFIDVFLKF